MPSPAERLADALYFHWTVLGQGNVVIMRLVLQDCHLWVGQDRASSHPLLDDVDEGLAGDVFRSEHLGPVGGTRGRLVANGNDLTHEMSILHVEGGEIE